MISGEPVPVAKRQGDSVIGGTVNQTGSFSMKAAHVGDETLLAQIVAMVADAQRSRAPVQQLVDRVAAVFVPTVVAVALLAFFAWAWLGPDPALANALMVSVAVLIVACPCALGLATPMSIMVGMGRGASEGVLLKDAAVLEQLAKVEVLVVDKTGTLTRGRPTLTEVEPALGRDESELLRLAASLEQQSEHPLGRALIEGAEGKGLRLDTPAHFESVTGGGIVGSVGAVQLAIGSQRFLQSRHIVALDALDAKARALEERGRSVVFIAQDGALAGIVAVSDPIKEGAFAAVASLRARSVRIIMLSGDSSGAASAVAAELGIEEVQGGMSPGEKHDRVVALREQGLVVAMAGDGINDAPALAAADVGIAMGTGTDVAMESAGVTLVKGDLRAITRALALGEGVMRNIRQSLFFAFVYNGLGVPLAAGVLYPTFGLLLNPMIAAAAMSLSSLCVIGNALRLRQLRLD
jgi:Cu+-exporting ATPase